MILVYQITFGLFLITAFIYIFSYNYFNYKLNKSASFPNIKFHFPWEFQKLLFSKNLLAKNEETQNLLNNAIIANKVMLILVLLLFLILAVFRNVNVN